MSMFYHIIHFSSLDKKSVVALSLKDIDQAHTLYGASVTVTNELKMGRNRELVPALFCGAPQGANCDNKDNLDKENITFDSFGSFYRSDLNINYDVSLLSNASRINI